MLGALASTTIAGTAMAQAKPAIRQIGPLERVSADSFGLKSVTIALAMPGGRVMINDVTGRRVLLLDSTLSRATVVADTTGATANAYGTSWASLLSYRGDTALLVVPSTLSMFLLGPSGTTARVLAIPRPDDAQSLAGVGFGNSGFDGRGRLMYFHGSLPGIMMLGRGMQLLQDGKPTELTRILEQHSPGSLIGKMQADSGELLRIDLETRVLDTAAFVHVPKFTRELKLDAEGKLESIQTTPDALPLIDQWTILRDGTIAIVRGRDYHIDWIDASGKRTSSPKIPFDWQRVSDERKTALIDSAVAVWQKSFDDNAAARARGPARGAGGGNTGGRGGGGGGGGGAGRGPAFEDAPNVATRASLNDLPDYLPPFAERAITADVDDNMWIRTTAMVDNRPVYDVVNRRGELIDRVQLPRYRTIAGFGPGVVYMAVVDAGGKVHLERARLK